MITIFVSPLTFSPVINGLHLLLRDYPMREADRRIENECMMNMDAAGSEHLQFSPFQFQLPLQGTVFLYKPSHQSATTVALLWP